MKNIEEDSALEAAGWRAELDRPCVGPQRDGGGGIMVHIVDQTTDGAARGTTASRTERKTVTDLYIRVCRDSSFSLGVVRSAQVVGSILGLHPLQVWMAVGSLDAMERVANGSHPAARRDGGDKPSTTRTDDQAASEPKSPQPSAEGSAGQDEGAG